MAKLDDNDLKQMDESYFQSLDKERLVEVAQNLHQLATELWEKQQQNSGNSSRPPSSDNPYQSLKSEELVSEKESTIDSKEENPKNQGFAPKKNKESQKKKPGKQPGAPGQWRSTPLEAQIIIPHNPHQCAACSQPLESSNKKPCSGHYALELVSGESGFKIICQLHHYYQATCSCGHITTAKPGVGYISVVEGRSRDLKLTEAVLVAPMLATFIASLGVRYRLSRTKIREFLWDWAQTELSIGTIDRCIREAGIACVPVVEELVEQLQQEDILHLDETHWYEQGTLRWLWVAVTAQIAVFHIGARTKEELSYLVRDAFIGWLVSDGYHAYRSHPKRQRCLAHLIRKAVAITGAINQKAAQIGQWLLDDLKDLITIIANAGGKREVGKILARLHRACNLGKKADHIKLRALAREILNDWNAVVAFVNHPELPPTNNEAERALRHAVIARRIGYGTRTSEGSLAYSSLLSVIETCRLRNLNPWTFIAEVITAGRKGLNPPSVPTV